MIRSPFERIKSTIDEQNKKFLINGHAINGAAEERLIVVGEITVGATVLTEVKIIDNTGAAQ